MPPTARGPAFHGPAFHGPAFSGHGLARPVAWTTRPAVDQRPAADAPGTLGKPLVPFRVASPRLDEELFARLLSYGITQPVAAGEVLFEPGDQDVDLIVVVEGVVEVIRTATADVPAETVAAVDAGGFVGELNLLTGQNVYLQCRVRFAGTIGRVPPDRLRQLMSNDVELSDVIFKALIARRELLRRSTAARGFEIVGSPLSAAALALRTYAARQQLIHLWFDASTPAGQAMMDNSGLTAGDLPAVVMPGVTLKRTTPGELAQKLNLSYHRSSTKPVDVTIIGAGPAGLAAAVYGASEGLDTLLLDAVGTGGQAAASSRIENYMGFPFGLSGADLTGRAVLQALKFGAQLASPCPVVKLDPDRLGDGHLRLYLPGDEVIDSKTVVIATGARYRALPLDRWSDFEGAGIYYAATELEARGCTGSPVAVVGGANSAGQAALYLAGRGSEVALIVRGPDIAAGMSAYLVDRLLAHPRVTVRHRSEVTRLDGEDFLQEVSITDRAGDTTQAQACSALFCFIGAEPATSWLTGIATGDDGFIRTDMQLTDDDLGAAWGGLSRRPLPFETSVPGIFAVGDVRSGSMKRVAAATGEGASAIASVHKALAGLG
ncbi:MAG: FAD-dependent oxidoreductase [Actinobacteria bacterium]|nr:FAD-dependent oxidoreductase [Actinomycetota bacterium]